ncbi:MAG: potassium-transporting ATPase subunit KdpA, partial [Sciscionella sp.]
MSSATAGWLQVGSLVAALAAFHRPLGEYMAQVFSSTRHVRVERAVYRLIGVDADADQRWGVYLRSVLPFSL